MAEHNLKKKAFYNICGILKQTLEYAMDAEYIEKNPYRVKVNKKKFASSSKKPSAKEVFQAGEKELFINEMERRLANNPSNTAPLAVLLDFELGTRKGEILAISKSVITGDRWLPLTEKAKEIIRRVEETNKEYGYSYEDFLFVKAGRCISPDAVDAQIKRGCDYIGIPVKAMHKIRKTYASTLLHNGVNISIVKDMLGHADESTTLKHYIYNTEDSTETDYKVLDALEAKKITKSDQSDQKIISFPKNKKARNIEMPTFPAL